MMGATQSLTSSERDIYDYVSAHRDGASYLLAVQSWSEASPYILATGQEVMPMGGFSGSVPEPTLARVQQLVKTGQLRFFLLSGTGHSEGSTGNSEDSTGGGIGGGPGGFMGRGGSGSVRSIESWVEKTCSAVPAKDYGGTASSASSTGSGAGTLYECEG
jgi:4-amino-4-deoxy-L-arabinose transferase-like glycosyltransferase